MKEATLPFNGFSPQLFYFLSELKKNNNVEWFRKNKDRYQQFLVEPAKGFITALAPFLNRLNPAIRTEPKFNHTIMRLNKDMRFAKGEPYRPFLLIHFGKFKMDSEFYLYFNHEMTQLGLFINCAKDDNHYFRQNITKHKKKITEVCKKYKIDNYYSLSDLNEESEPIVTKFNVDKHFNLFNKIDYILLHRIKPLSEKVLYSSKLIDEMIKMVSQLYPLYCFTISSNPLKDLQRFEDEFGEII